MRLFACRLVTAAVPLLFALTLSAQGTRTATEPHILALCVTLKARIAAVHGMIPARDESSLDTTRIQNAIDTCTPGKAVVLSNDGARNVFFIGPISLRSGVTLVVKANTALVASRDPRRAEQLRNPFQTPRPRLQAAYHCHRRREQRNQLSPDGESGFGVREFVVCT